MSFLRHSYFDGWRATPSRQDNMVIMTSLQLRTLDREWDSTMNSNGGVSKCLSGRKSNVVMESSETSPYVSLTCSLQLPAFYLFVRYLFVKYSVFANSRSGASPPRPSRSRWPPGVRLWMSSLHFGSARFSCTLEFS